MKINYHERELSQKKKPVVIQILCMKKISKFFMFYYRLLLLGKIRIIWQKLKLENGSFKLAIDRRMCD